MTDLDRLFSWLREKMDQGFVVHWDDERVYALYEGQDFYEMQLDPDPERNGSTVVAFYEDEMEDFDWSELNSRLLVSRAEAFDVRQILGR